MKLGIIITSHRWINNNIVESASAAADTVMINFFGCPKGISKEYQDRYKTTESTHADYRSRKYISVTKKSLHHLYEKGMDYVLCIHGSSIEIAGIKLLASHIEANTSKDFIEQHVFDKDKETFSVGHLKSISIGRNRIGRSINSVIKSLMRKSPYQPYRNYSLRFGNDSWGLSRETINYIVNSEYSKKFFFDITFALDPKNFFFHTLSMRTAAEKITDSPEAYASKDFISYHRAYRDHATTMRQQGLYLFYPTAKSMLTLPENCQEEKTGTVSSPFTPPTQKGLPPLYHFSNRFGALGAQKKPLFIIFTLDMNNIMNFWEKINTDSNIVCHGNIYNTQEIMYAKEDHVCPRYGRNDTFSRNWHYPTFINDLINFYEEKFFGLAIDLRYDHIMNYLLTEYKNIYSLFVIPDIIYDKLSMTTTKVGRDVKLDINIDIKSLLNISELQCKSSTMARFHSVLSCIHIYNNNFMIVKESDVQNIDFCKQFTNKLTEYFS